MIHLTLTCFKSNESHYHQISAQDRSLMDFIEKNSCKYKVLHHKKVVNTKHRDPIVQSAGRQNYVNTSNLLCKYQL